MKMGFLKELIQGNFKTRCKKAKQKCKKIQEEFLEYIKRNMKIGEEEIE